MIRMDWINTSCDDLLKSLRRSASRSAGFTAGEVQDIADTLAWCEKIGLRTRAKVLEFAAKHLNRRRIFSPPLGVERTARRRVSERTGKEVHTEGSVKLCSIVALPPVHPAGGITRAVGQVILVAS